MVTCTLVDYFPSSKIIKEVSPSLYRNLDAVLKDIAYFTNSDKAKKTEQLTVLVSFINSIIADYKLEEPNRLKFNLSAMLNRVLGVANAIDQVNRPRLSKGGRFYCIYNSTASNGEFVVINGNLVTVADNLFVLTDNIGIVYASITNSKLLFKSQYIATVTSSIMNRLIIARNAIDDKNNWEDSDNE